MGRLREFLRLQKMNFLQMKYEWEFKSSVIQDFSVLYVNICAKVHQSVKVKVKKYPVNTKCN